MSKTNVKQLHWTQRLALVRHNLHSACRSGDFGFFKSLQTASLVEGTNHFATLTAGLGDEADIVLAALDNLNAALAFMHQDAFQMVYNNLKNSMKDDDEKADRSKLYVDIAMEKNNAARAVDKLFNSATALINQQPAHVQDGAANVFITSMTLTADCVELIYKQFDTLDQKMDDFIRLKESWNTVKASVMSANAGLKGVFYMLDPTDPQEKEVPRNLSISSASSAMFRRLSSAFQSPPPSRRASVASGSASIGAAAPRPSISSSSSVYRTPNYVRSSVSTEYSTSMLSQAQTGNFDAHTFNKCQCHKLPTIPPTPATPLEGNNCSEEKDPFDTTAEPMPAIVPVRPLTIAQRRMSHVVM